MSGLGFRVEGLYGVGLGVFRVIRVVIRLGLGVLRAFSLSRGTAIPRYYICIKTL